MRFFNKIYTTILKENTDPDVDTQGSGKFDEEYVMRFIRGLRFIVKKRNTYFHSLLQKVPIIVTDPDDKRIRTMAVDAMGNLYINPRFASGLLKVKEPSARDQNFKYQEGDSYLEATEGEKQFLGVIAHELMHIFKDHMMRGERFPQQMGIGKEKVWLWNIATDIEINDELMYKWGYYLPSGGIITKPDGTYNIKIKKDGKEEDVVLPVRGRSPERIHKMIMDNVPKSEDSDEDSGGGSSQPLQPGDVIYDKKSGKYGEIVTISPNGKAKIKEITKEEAKQRTK